MINYVVTTRNKNGSLEERAYTAADRSDLFKQLSADVITAVRIREGSPSKKSAKSAVSGSSSKFTGVTIAALLLVAIGVVCYFLFPSDKTPAPIVETTKAKPKNEVAPRPVPTPKPQPTTVAEEKPTEPEQPKIKPAPWRGKNLSNEKRAELYEKTLAEREIPKASTNRLFRTGLEQVMGWIFTTEVGDLPPPLPNISDFDFVHLQEILEIKNDVKETDSDKQADTKATVDFAKKELKKYLERGGDPQEFLAYYHDELKAAYQERQIAQQQVMKVLTTEPELVDEYLQKVNADLAERGIKGVVIPERTRRRIEGQMSNQ